MNPDFHFYLVSSFKCGVIAHFLYVVSWEEKLHLSTVVAPPPEVSEFTEQSMCCKSITKMLKMVVKLCVSVCVLTSHRSP